MCLFLSSPGRLGPRELIEVSLQHPIIDLPVLIRLPAKIPLCVLVGGDHVGRPGVQLPETLDEKVVQQLLESTSSTDLPLGTRDRAILELLYGCGIRVSELVNLLIEHYNPKEQFLRVTGKGHKTRFVPVGSKAVEALSLYLSQARPTLVKPRSRSFIFLSRRGTQLTRERIRQIIRERAQQAGIDDRVYPHLMRHSFATHLLHHGADLRIIQELLGHADISTTQIYTHVDENTLRSIHSQFHPRNKIPLNPSPSQNKRDE